jgi:Co/Zn/Cd efflux system component
LDEFFLNMGAASTESAVAEENAEREAAAGVRDDETSAMERVALLGFFLNLALVAVKGVLAVLSGSLAVTASAVDSATDSLSSLVLY